MKFSKEVIKSKEISNTKKLLILSYLKLNSPINGNVGISIDMLCKKIGYIPNQRKNKINEKIIEILCILKKENIINYKHEDITKKNDCFIINVNNEHDIFNAEDNFVLLTYEEFKKITDSNLKSTTQDLLNVFLNIKKFINLSSSTLNVCYPSHKTLSSDTNIVSTGSLNYIIDDLIKIKMLHTYNSGMFKDKNGKLKYSNNFYALDKNELKKKECDNIIKEYYNSMGLSIKGFIKE